MMMSPKWKKIMEQVKQTASEITCIKKDLNDHKKDIIYLNDDKV